MASDDEKDLAFHIDVTGYLHKGRLTWVQMARDHFNYEVKEEAALTTYKL